MPPGTEWHQQQRQRQHGACAHVHCRRRTTACRRVEGAYTTASVKRMRPVASPPACSRRLLAEQRCELCGFKRRYTPCDNRYPRPIPTLTRCAQGTTADGAAQLFSMGNKRAPQRLHARFTSNIFQKQHACARWLPRHGSHGVWAARAPRCATCPPTPKPQGLTTSPPAPAALLT